MTYITCMHASHTCISYIHYMTHKDLLHQHITSHHRHYITLHHITLHYISHKHKYIHTSCTLQTYIHT